MKSLGRYLVGLFAREALGIFVLSVSMMFLVQCLRVTDIGGFAGGSFGNGLLSALFGLADTAVVFLAVAVAMGLGRGLRALGQSRELHIIHAGNRLAGLAGAAALYLAAGALLVLGLAHEGAPRAVRQSALLQAEAAADLVNRSLTANAFAEIGAGVTVSVSGRRTGGQVTGFFADDRRGDPRRTYLARSALIARDTQGYVLRLEDGRVQYLFSDGRFSEMAFDTYDLGLDRLTEADAIGQQARSTPSSELLASPGPMTVDAARRLAERNADALRVLALGLLVFAISGFPDGRRRPPRLPIEIVILGAALVDRVGLAVLPGPPALVPYVGPALGALVALILLARQTMPRRFPRAAT